MSYIMIQIRVDVHNNVFLLLGYNLYNMWSCKLTFVPSVHVCHSCLAGRMLFMPPAWKVCRGHLVFGSSVRPSVCLSGRPFVRTFVPLTFKVKYLKFWWSYSNQTWTVSSSMGCSSFTDITCPWGWGGVKILDFEILPYFDFVAAGGIRVWSLVWSIKYLYL